MCPSRSLLLFYVLGVFLIINESEASWEEWWTYDGISGPSFWGLINPQWSLCSKGRRQSPINIEPDKLLFDPHLRPVHVDKHKVSGHLHNTGQFLVFRADKEAKIRVNITGGPLAYHYQFEEIYIHYGLDDNHGSEHRVDDYAFPAELGETLNPELRIITSVFSKVLHRGDTAQVSYLSLRSLLPDTNGYMTYEGSTTHPGCWETAVWLILNKPIYITAQELYALRKLMQGPASAPKAPLGNNSRPLQDLHHRTIRTNINFRKPTLGETTDPCLTTSFELFAQSRAFNGTPFLFQGGGVGGDEGGDENSGGGGGGGEEEGGAGGGEIGGEGSGGGEGGKGE
ncbi:carbonic anhydrase-related protein 10-like isoform X3 [Vespa velutina]|uniref:carbonic anhydrase-related protein 10-like isoform X3 n=1 Tax=Vespa velutina TaxID=202808 RepID=UPI001FB21E1F|nr:carbonic anhydrase-related protein 10-like isoform X3 [Vespa velutina]